MIFTCKPTKVEIFDNRDTRYNAAKVKAVTGADIVFNGSLFDMTTYKPCCDIKANGVILNNDPYTYWGYGWRNGELPRVAHTNDMPALDNYISCICAIHNGEKQSVNDNQAGIGGVRGRTAFGFKDNGEMVIICTSDKNGAMKLSEVRDKLFNAGCVNGIILDGGGSSQIITPTESITSSRIVSNFICVWIDKNKNTQNDTQKGNNMLNIIQPNYKWAYAMTPRKSTDYIVLHHVGVVGDFSPEEIHAGHLAKNWRGIGYHFYVRKNGTIYRGREENATGGHTLNYNNNSIGICFEGNFEVETMPQAQFEAGQALIAELAKKYPKAKIVKHSMLNATACPGKNFPFDTIIKPPATNVTSSNRVYRVQVGAFGTRSGAEMFVKELEAKGYKPVIVEVEK